MIPFSPPHIDDKIVDAVTAVLRSGWITTGPKTKLFEKKMMIYQKDNRKKKIINTKGLQQYKEKLRSFNFQQPRKMK